MIWLDTNYLKKKSFTIDHTKVGSSVDETDYVLLIDRTDADFATVANGGYAQSPNAYDFRAANAAENAWLDSQVQSYNASTGHLIFRVRIPTLSHTADTVIWLYFDNSTITSTQDVTTTWPSKFKTVLHCEETTGTTIGDATSNAANATKTSSGHPASATGQVGNGLNFATSDYMTISSAAPQITGDLTVRGWFNTANFTYPSGFAPRIIFCNVNGTNSFQLCIINNTGANGHFNNFGWFVDDSTGEHTVSGGTDLSANTWYFVEATYVASSHAVALYVTGSSVSGGGAGGFGTASNDGKLYIGQRQDGAGVYTGLADEIEIIAAADTAGQALTYANNQTSPSTFYTVGSLQSQSTSVLKDITTRFRLMSANQLKDVTTRFRLRSADRLKDIASRFRLQSANQNKDISTRLRLQSASQLKDVAVRFRLMSTNQLKDISSRFRLRSADQFKDIAGRFRLMSASQLRDVASRFRLMSASQLKDVPTRLRLMSANQLKDVSTRLRLMSANRLRDVATRFILGAGSTRAKDISTRFILVIPTVVAVVHGRDGNAIASGRDGNAIMKGA